MSKVAVVIGGTGGIGRAIHQEFLDNGIISISTSLHSATNALDVRDDKKVLLFFRTISHIDICVYAVGIPFFGKVEKLFVRDLQGGFDLYVKGLFNVIKAVLPKMKVNRGRLIVIGGLRSFIPSQNKSVYCSMKAASTMLLSCLQEEVRQYGIQITTIHPGFTNTMFHKENAKRPFEFVQGIWKEISITQPEDIAKIAYMLTTLSLGAEMKEIQVGRAFNFYEKGLRLESCSEIKK